MTKTIRSFVLFSIGALVSSSAFAQPSPTQPKLNQIAYSTQATQVIVSVPGKPLTSAVLDPSIVIEATDTGYILRVIQPAQSAPSVVHVIGETVDVQAPRQDFVLQGPPVAGSVAVYRNGLRMRVGPDYAINGAAVTFTQAQLPQAGDVLLFDYDK